MNVAETAAGYYLERWQALRNEARRVSAEAAKAPPLTRWRLRNQAALDDDYSVILHHAAWAELNDPDPMMVADR